MNPGALRALEFDRIVEAVGRFALTPAGGTRLADLHPHVDAFHVRRALDATAETVSFLTDAQIGLQAPAELDVALPSLAVEGRGLEPLQLLGLGAFLTSVESTVSAIRRWRDAAILRGIADAVAPFEQETAAIHRKIE